MLKISKQQINERWDATPEILRESLCSFENGKIIWQIGKEQHLDDKKIGIIAALSGYAIYGFIQLNDLAKEIKANLNLHSEIADSIAKEIESKIFSSIKNEMKKSYDSSLIHKPAGDFKEDILDLRTQMPSPIKTEPEKIISPEPAPIQSEPVGEAPLIIHKEAEFKPVLGAKRPLSGLFGALKGKEEIKPITAQIEILSKEPPLPSIEEQLKNIKIIPEKKIEEPKIISSEPSKPKIVHYTDLRTPLPPLPIDQKKTTEAISKAPLSVLPLPKQKKKGFFSWLIGIFIGKEKTLKEISDKDILMEIPIPQNMPEVKIPIQPIIPEKPPIPSPPSPKPVVEIPKPPREETKVFEIKTQNIPKNIPVAKPVLPQEAVKIQPPIPPIPKAEPPKTTSSEEIIDLRTFEKFKGNN